MSPAAPPDVRRGRRQLLALAALFFVPLAVAFWMYYGPADWRPAGDASKGDLIDPARPLAAIALPTAEGHPMDAKFLRGKWTLVKIKRGVKEWLFIKERDGYVGKNGDDFPQGSVLSGLTVEELRDGADRAAPLRKALAKLAAPRRAVTAAECEPMLAETRGRIFQGGCWRSLHFNAIAPRY